jgi:Flp pilus assembly pilin Flp
MCKFVREEEGTAAIEYALLISLVGMAIAGAFQALGEHLFDKISVVDEALSSVQFTDERLKRK